MTWSSRDIEHERWLAKQAEDSAYRLRLRGYDDAAARLDRKAAEHDAWAARMKREEA